MYLPGVVLIKQSRTPPEQAQQGAVSSHFRKSIRHHPNEGLLDPRLLVGPPAPTPLSSSPLKKIGGLGVGTHQGGPHCLPCLLLHPGRIKVLEFLGGERRMRTLLPWHQGCVLICHERGAHPADLKPPLSQFPLPVFMNPLASAFPSTAITLKIRTCG